MDRSPLPLLDHPFEQASEITSEALITAVRDERVLPAEPLPPVCVLDFDGDLTDWLVSTGVVRPCPQWACFHTSMQALEVDGIACGIFLEPSVGRTLPFGAGPSEERNLLAETVAEQMWVVADLDDDYIAKMEDVLEAYERPYDPQQPVICVDEKSVTLHADVRPASPAVPGRKARRRSVR